jgi:hypothetical protein
MDSAEEVLKYFRRRKVSELEPLRRVLGGRSRRTVFRDLSAVGYRTSFTHAGRFYTLRDIPQFDRFGLWFHRDVGFSEAGTLKETVALLVEQTPDGRTHGELAHLLRVRVHNTLLDLLRQGRIGRERLDRVFLYVSPDSTRASAQVAARRELAASLAEMLRVATDEEVVEVLVEALRAAPEIPDEAVVAARLVARGVRLEPHHVTQVYEEHGLSPGKKTAQPNSRPSRR